MHVKMILPSLQEAGTPQWRPIKYSLFPPLGLATLAAYLDESGEIELVDQHVETLDLNDEPDLVIIQVYITSASRAYQMQIIIAPKAVMFALADCTLPRFLMRRHNMLILFFLNQAKKPFRSFWMITVSAVLSLATFLACVL